jgi:hypothetical protein
MGNGLNKSVRKYHTVSRCAQGLRSASDVVKGKAVENVEEIDLVYLEHFTEELSTTVCVVTSPLVKPTTSTRPRSHSLVLPVLQEIAVDFLGRRIANNFDGDVFFGAVSGRVRGLVVVAEPSNGTRLLQAVWKVAYDDGDSVQLIRVELLAALRTYHLHAQKESPKIPFT